MKLDSRQSSKVGNLKAFNISNHFFYVAFQRFFCFVLFSRFFAHTYVYHPNNHDQSLCYSSSTLFRTWKHILVHFNKQLQCSTQLLCFMVPSIINKDSLQFKNTSGSASSGHLWGGHCFEPSQVSPVFSWGMNHC